MTVEQVAQRVATLATRLRRSTIAIMAVDILGAAFAVFGLLRVGWGIGALVVGLVLLTPLLPLWSFRRALEAVIALPERLSQGTFGVGDITTSLSAAATSVVDGDRNVRGFIRTARELRSGVEELRATNAGAVLDGLRAVQPGQLAAAAGATAMAFGAFVLGLVVLAVGLVFG